RQQVLTPAQPSATGQTGVPAPVPEVSAWVLELNRIIEGQNLFDQERFKAVKLSNDTQALLAEIVGASGPENQEPRQRLNRLVLEDAFPEAITRENRLRAEMLNKFWDHPLARSLSPEGQFPSYVEPATFAAIVIDVALPGAEDGTAPSTA